MPTIQENPATTLSHRALEAFDRLEGPHAGMRPTHAKGILLTGSFTPSPEAAELSRAPHLQRTLPISVRFSNFTGIPNIPDNSPNASPRGIAVRLHLAEHRHTDIVAHSVDGFPARTAEEFIDFLTAAYESAHSAERPSAIEKLLGTHPAALAFVQAPKPIPTSFARESFFGVSAYVFTNAAGLVRHGRYRIRAEEGNEYLTEEQASTQPPNFLFDEIAARLSAGSAKLSVYVQIAAAGDVTDDSTVHWPQDRIEIKLGVLELSAVAPENEAAQRHIIFDPIPRVDGIDPSGDPLLQPRADLYLLSGRRRRTNAAL